mmetsp:Transcript_25169/g.75113  ORF Transcript_25169/g.75113 Transcript_25169/m.75113 type:complete len:554 (-) Transcript_25169:131-1792(-)
MPSRRARSPLRMSSSGGGTPAPACGDSSLDSVERGAKGGSESAAQRLPLCGGTYSIDLMSTCLGSCSCGGGVPRKEAERWCAEITAQLQAVSDALEAKLSQYRNEIAKRGVVIKRLYWRLQCTELLPGTSMSTGRGRASATASPLTNSGLRGRASPSTTATATPTPIGSPAMGMRTVAVTASEGAGITRGGRAGSLSPARSMPVVDPAGGSTARVRPGYAAEDRGLPRPRRPTTEGGPGTFGIPSSSVTSPMSSHPASSSALAPARKPRQRDGGSEHTALVHLRQEVAQLKRQNADLSEQVRARDMQVDNLTGMIREMQAQAQRQRRLRDDTLQAMQEEFLSRGVASSFIAATAADAAKAPSTGGATSSRQAPTEPCPGAQQATPKGAGTTLQAPRGSRRGTADGSYSERGSSVTRSSSALARRKDQTLARRTSFAPPPSSTSGGQSLRAFSPRALHQPQPQPAAQPNTSGRERMQLSTAQAAPASGHEVEPLRRMAAVATLPQSTSPSSPVAPSRSLLAGGSIPAPRSSSVDVRARARSSMNNAMRRVARRS